ncbi:MAG TPA: DUF4256 domain-containing protein [Chloroflexi bacterium]|nr:DUF4256 domain-containing protein [Chloroflexota bacterium]HHW87985.1 DUF4256 domain-containing protein [Chloroflexota bacterium]
MQDFETVQTLSSEQREALLHSLKARFEQHMHRHPGLRWADVQARLEANPEKLWSLHAMESTGGEPDVVGYEQATGAYIFYDCAAESPSGRRNICYDRAGQMSRKENRPEHNAVDMAAALGIELLTEAQYRELQTLGEFDTKTSSWLQTPTAIRKLGGAIFGDRRYDHVFIYHNGAQSYYAARGFRGALRV